MPLASSRDELGAPDGLWKGISRDEWKGSSRDDKSVADTCPAGSFDSHRTAISRHGSFGRNTSFDAHHPGGSVDGAPVRRAS
eukprot:CAMPEP_0173451342 /NCGR_PEP_ID=MMETSP1357-20121228/46610_1 /TAXON_ID=77926 /ORGANISM="Hemiselmis rufescens, Strain PCC563" /LENGTH=81 /DNA_ID=CAMNT_0014418093 /DNA_START=12 /DNA_END=253 /DNA_ORIENTATION=+